MKRALSLMLAIGMLFALTGCGTGTGDGEKLTCTLEIRCDTLLDHLDELSEGKAALVPEDGRILPAVEVEIQSGATVIDVLRQVLREEKIHFEYTDATAYDSAYIEGIGNLYEFDCGPQSGWMYSVNGVYPGLGCGSYTLSEGDAIVFSYTCNLGEDLGAEKSDEK